MKNKTGQHAKTLSVIVLVIGLFIVLPTPCTSGDSKPEQKKELELQIDKSPLERNAERPAPTSYSNVIEQVAPAVVNVFSTKTVKMNQQQLPFFNDPFFRRFFENPRDQKPDQPRERKQRSLGSGVIISKDGYILTNHHVVENADEVKIALAQTDKEYDAKTIGSDPKTDLAVLKVDTKDELPVATLGDSENIKIGDVVFAIGNPFGVGKTVTMGIVSAKSRGLGMLDYENFIQTDASINPGNSGGALIDAGGRVIGINTVIISRSGGSQGIGFSIPINLAQSIAKRIVETGEVSRGFLGVQIQEVTPELKEHFDLDQEGGVLISSVIDGMPAKEAGLQKGDVIVEFNGKTITSLKDLRFAVANTPPGTETTVTVVRDGKQKSFTLKLARMPKEGGLAGTPDSGKGEEPAFDLLKGVSVQSLTATLRQQLNVPDTVEGLLVTDVQVNSPAHEAGLRKQDVIQEINKQPVKNIQDARKALQAGRHNAALLYIWRDGNGHYMVIRNNE